MTKDDQQLAQMLQDEEELEQRSRLLFLRLLDRQREKAGHIFALRMNMGITESYLTSVPLSWVAEKIMFAADIPLFKENNANIDSKAININENTVDLLQQRQPDWRRQFPMSLYLANRDNHKFPPLLIVGYQTWAYDGQNNDKWGADNKAISPSIPIEQLDSNGYFMDLHDQETQYYALDGQHRLMAIRGLRDLLFDGHLFPRNQDSKRKSSGEIYLDDIVDSIKRRRQSTNPEANVDEQEISGILRNRMNETIGVEIIPAIQRGETREEAIDRLRQIFVDVNEQAKQPSKGDNILLDNNDGFRVVARRLMVSHKLLNNEKTKTTAGQLSENSSCYTTLQELVTITEAYLKQNREYESWKNPSIIGEPSSGYILPALNDLEKGMVSMRNYFDALLKLPSHEYFVQALPENRAKLRTEHKKEEDISPSSLAIRDNILFRPIAQTALANAIGTILAQSEIPAEQINQKLYSIIDIIAQQEKKGMLQLRNPKSPWFGVLCDTVDKKMRRHNKYQELCSRMFVYLLYGMENGALEGLRNDFADARKTSATKGVPLEGEEVDLDKIRLPHPWRS